MSLPVVLLATALPAAFAPVVPLVGHCWRGTLPDGGVDTHCFARARGGVRDRHVVRRRGRAVYAGVTDYVAAAGGLRWAYRNAGGPVMRGEVTARAGEIRLSVKNGAPLIWRWRGTRAYAARVGPSGEAVTYRRVERGVTSGSARN